MQKKEHLAAKLHVQQLRTDMADLKVELIKWNVGTLIAMTGMFAAIVKLKHCPLDKIRTRSSVGERWRV